MKDWLLHGAIETDERMAADLAGPGYHIKRSNLGLYARSVEFPDFFARYDAPGSIAGHRRGVRVRAV
jgi:hypothetical protein